MYVSLYNFERWINRQNERPTVAEILAKGQYRMTMHGAAEKRIGHYCIYPFALVRGGHNGGDDAIVGAVNQRIMCFVDPERCWIAKDIVAEITLAMTSSSAVARAVRAVRLGLTMGESRLKKLRGGGSYTDEECLFPLEIGDDTRLANEAQRQEIAAHMLPINTGAALNRVQYMHKLDLFKDNSGGLWLQSGPMREHCGAIECRTEGEIECIKQILGANNHVDAASLQW